MDNFQNNNNLNNNENGQEQNNTQSSFSYDYAKNDTINTSGTVVEEKPKKKKKTEQPQKPAPKKEEKPNDNFLKELGLSGIVNLFTRITELAAGVLKDFFAHIIIKSFALSIKVGGKDAADTAINYGKVCSVVYPLTSAVISSMKYTHYGVDILPDFTEGAETKIEFFAIFKTRIAHLVKIVLKHGFKALKMLMELKNIKDN